MSNSIHIADIVCMSYALLLSAHTWLQQATSQCRGPTPCCGSQRARHRYRRGCVAGAAGYGEVWITSASADDYRALLRVMGTLG